MDVSFDPVFWLLHSPQVNTSGVLQPLAFIYCSNVDTILDIGQFFATILDVYKSFQIVRDHRTSPVRPRGTNDLSKLDLRDKTISR